MSNMEVDGSFGEGGGQILRTSIALGALLNEPIELYNIRVNRPKPGLANQHLAGIRALRDMTCGEVTGAEIGSTRVGFYPGRLGSGRYVIDTGTAGSITLILQALFIPAIFSQEGVELDLRGGTDVRWSPPVDYVGHVFLPALRMMGINAELEVVKRGYYPKGNGRVVVHISPVDRLKPLKVMERGDLIGIHGRSHSLNLPNHIVKRMADSVKDLCRCSIDIEHGKGVSTGCGISLWAKFQNSVLGASALGAPGKPAEKVGEEAIKMLTREIEGRAAFDLFMGDQIIPYMGLAPGRSEFTVRELTGHILSNIYVAEKILGVKYDITEKGGVYVIKTKGIGFVNDHILR